jgi:hypothetical protein
MISSAASVIKRLEKLFRGQGTSGQTTEDLLGPARHLIEVDDGLRVNLDGFHMPSVEELLLVAYQDVGYGEWAIPVYSVLSQFIHATPIAHWHLKPSQWTSLTAPMASLALDAAAHGFTFLCYSNLAVAGADVAVTRDSVERLMRVTGRVHREAVAFHMIG